jgi:hypothetical protein
MTHILIPIKGIETEILSNTEYLDSVKRENRNYDWDSIYHQTEFLKNLLDRKQISLDEKGIIDKAEQVYPFISEVDYDTGNVFDCNRNYRIGYKQALKDLL